jgi:hypothetical protein
MTCTHHQILFGSSNREERDGSIIGSHFHGGGVGSVDFETSDFSALSVLSSHHAGAVIS